MRAGSTTTDFGHFVRDDYFVSRFDGTNEVETLALAGAWPAAIEVSCTVETDIQRAGEGKVGGKSLLDEVAITGSESVENVEYGFCSARRVSAPPDDVPSC